MFWGINVCSEEKKNSERVNGRHISVHYLLQKRFLQRFGVLDFTFFKEDCFAVRICDSIPHRRYWMDRYARDLLITAYHTGENSYTKIHKLKDTAGIVVTMDSKGVVYLGHIYNTGVKYPNFVGSAPIINHLMNRLIQDSGDKITKVEYREDDILTKSLFSCYNVDNNNRRSEMDNSELIRKILDTGEAKGTMGGMPYEVRGNAGLKKIKLADSYFTAVGNKRLRILKSNEKEFEEVAVGSKIKSTTSSGQKAKKKRSKAAPPNLDKKCEKCGKDFTASKFTPYVKVCSECKPRKSKESLPDRIEKTCEQCQKTFETSKFTKYVKLCPDCKPRRSRGEAKPVEPRKCEVTGEMFTPSKFNPKATVSPEGKKILKDREKRDGQIDKAVAEVKGHPKLVGTPEEEIRTVVEKAWDNEGIRAWPSLVKAAKEHLIVKPKKEVKTYEASEEEQAAALDS